VAAVFAVSVGLSADAQGALSGSTDSHVSFLAAGPAGMKIEGTTNDLTLAEQGDNVVITVPLANLTTGIALRDRHMKEKYLEIAKYPSATMSVARSALKIPAGADKVEADAPSTVTIHGQTKPVTVHYESKRDGSSFSTRGRFHININEFGIAVPSYLGVTVKPDVDVTASFRANGS
jgi:polyisoprenoid-binding protein YceI